MKFPKLLKNKKIMALLAVILIIGIIILVVSMLFSNDIFEGLSDNQLIILDVTYCSINPPKGKAPKCTPPGVLGKLKEALTYNIKKNTLSIKVDPSISYKNGGIGIDPSDGSGPGTIDPAQGKVKQLTVIYKYGSNGDMKKVSVNDMNMLNISS